MQTQDGCRTQNVSGYDGGRSVSWTHLYSQFAIVHISRLILTTCFDT